MKFVVLTMAAMVAFGTIAPAFADTYVNGYTRSDGTYVQPHYRSSPNNTTLDNYSTRGNTNPYTGRQGTVDPYSGASRNYDSYEQPQGNTDRSGLYR